MRKPIIAGNWKMNKTDEESEVLVQGLLDNIDQGLYASVDVVVCPPFTAICRVKKALKDTQIAYGAQNMYFEDAGAYTGEISADMIKALGAQYCIIGHSERRAIFKETNEMVNLKVKKALEKGLIPIMCVGETLEQREAGQTFDIVKDHVENGLKDISADDMKKIIIAYEPVWAIGTGKTATPDQAQEVHAYIRKLLTELYDQDTADTVRIQYGGSVKPENIKDLISQADIDGALVGGASLKIDSFTAIVQGAKK